MDSTILYFILGVATLVVWGWRTYLQHKDDNTPWDPDSIFGDIRQAAELVEKYAPGVEQLVKLNELQPEEKRAHVIELVSEALPNLDPQVIKVLLENWVITQKPELKKIAQNLNSPVGN